jgi:hypothetical protein
MYFEQAFFTGHTNARACIKAQKRLNFSFI